MKKSLLVIATLLVFSLSFSQKSIEIDFYAENETVNLFAFIGEKVSVEEITDQFPTSVVKKVFDDETGDSVSVRFVNNMMDRVFRLKYRVVKNLYNNLNADTVEFLAYDHYGEPGFTYSENVILYITKSKEKGCYVQRKYQYNEIYKTKSNEWIGLLEFGSVWRVEEGLKLKSKLIKIKLDTEANLDITDTPKEYLHVLYPKPFYKIKNNIAIPVLGLSIKDLIEYKINDMIESNPGLFAK